MTTESMQAVKIAVIMLTVDQQAMTLRALESVMPQAGDGVKVLLWDNGSVDGTAVAVSERYPSVLIGRSEQNLGVAGGRNSAARLAVQVWCPDRLLFLDNDLVLREGFIKALEDTLDQNPDVGQVQGKLLYLDEPTRINDGGGCRIVYWRGNTDPVGFKEVDIGQCDAPGECVSCGGAMMVRRSVFEALGGFDESFSPYGPEDIDFSLRLKATGAGAVYNPAAVALHAANHTWGKDGYSAAYAQSRVKHWLRFMHRHASRAQIAGFYLFGAPMIALRMVVRELGRGNAAALAGSLRGMFAARRAPK